MKKALLLLILLFTFTTINAQSFYFGPQVGYVNIKGSSEGTFQYGAALRFSFIIFGIEGTASYSEKKYPGPFGTTIKATGIPISVTGMVYIIPSFLYGCAGFDWYNNKYTYSYPGYQDASETFTSTGYHLGAGVQIPLGPILLTGDARYLFSSHQNIANTELDMNYYLLQVGLLFKL